MTVIRPSRRAVVSCCRPLRRAVARRVVLMRRAVTRRVACFQLIYVVVVCAVVRCVVPSYRRIVPSRHAVVRCVVPSQFVLSR